MSRIFRRLLTRIIIFERATGNILDLPARRVLGSEVPDVSESRTQLTDGTTRATSRDHSIQLRIIGREESQLARIMADSCPVGLVALGQPGTRHLFWQEDAILSRVPGAAAALEHADDVLSLESGVFNPAIWGGDLIAGVPWEGTTAQNADTFAQVGTRDISDTGALDLGRGDDGEVKLVRRDDVVKDAFGSDSFSSDSAFCEGIDWDGSNYIIADSDASGPFIHRTDASGTERSGSPYTYPGQVPRSLAYYRPEDLCYVVDDDEDQVYVLDGSSSFGELRTVVPDSLSNPLGIAVDGDRLLIALLTGDLEVWEIESGGGGERFVREIGEASLITNPWAGSVQSWDGMVVDDGVLYGYESGAASADIVYTTQLGPVKGGGHDGAHWRVRSSTGVDITGQPTNVNSTYPAALQTILPAIGATLRLVNATGSVDAVDWNGTPLNLNQSDRIGSPPEITLEGGKYSGLGISSGAQIWQLVMRAETVAARPELRVVDPGQAIGARPGGTVSDCQTRVSSPAWGSVSAIDFDVDVDAEDKVEINVVDPVGNYVGQISGDGESVNGTSATFTYDQAGVYTAEMVAQPNFEGVTDATIEGPIDLSTLTMSSAEDLIQADIFDQGSTLTGSTRADLVPDSLEDLEINNSGSRSQNSCTFEGHTLADTLDVLTLRFISIGASKSDFENSGIPTIGFISTKWDVTLDESFFHADSVQVVTQKGGDKPLIDMTAIAKEAPAMERVLAFRRSNITGDPRKLLASCRSMVDLFDVDVPGYDLSGTIQSSDQEGSSPGSIGEPIIPSSLETLHLRGDASSRPTPPTDFSAATALAELNFLGRQMNNMTPTVQGLLDAVNGGVDLSGCDVKLQDGVRRRNYPVGWKPYNDILPLSGAPSFLWNLERTQPIKVEAIDATDDYVDINVEGSTYNYSLPTPLSADPEAGQLLLGLVNLGSSNADGSQRGLKVVSSLDSDAAPTGQTRIYVDSAEDSVASATVGNGATAWLWNIDR